MNVGFQLFHLMKDSTDAVSLVFVQNSSNILANNTKNYADLLTSFRIFELDISIWEAIEKYKLRTLKWSQSWPFPLKVQANCSNTKGWCKDTSSHRLVITEIVTGPNEGHPLFIFFTRKAKLPAPKTFFFNGRRRMQNHVVVSLR